MVNTINYVADPESYWFGSPVNLTEAQVEKACRLHGFTLAEVREDTPELKPLPSGKYRTNVLAMALGY